MIDTYEEYLTLPKALSIDKMISLHRQIADEIGSDLDAIDLYDELLEAAVKYAKIRADWVMMSREEKMEKDPLRTALHNNVILQVNVLARYLRQVGKPALWREELGDEETDPTCRKVLGDFACYLAFVSGLCAR